MSFQTINIVDKFKEFIESLDHELLTVFKKYCLGIRSDAILNNPYIWSFEDYYNLLKYVLRISNITNNKFNFVKIRYINSHKELCEKGVTTVWSVNIYSGKNRIKLRNPGINYYLLGCIDIENWEPEIKVDLKRSVTQLNPITIKDLQENPGTLFFIHQNIQSVDEKELLLLIEAYLKFQCKYLYSIEYEYIAAICNKKMIYRTKTPLSKHGIKLTNSKNCNIPISIYGIITESPESIVNKQHFFDF